MKKVLLFSLAMTMSGMLWSQYIYTDFDGNENETFSGWWNNPVKVSNPFPDGVNPSANVGQWERVDPGQWEHIYTVVNGAVNFTTGFTFQIKVYSPVVCEILCKLEGTVPPVEVWDTISVTNQWVLKTFDFGSLNPQSGVYNKIIFFFDTPWPDPAAVNTFYFDDIEGPGYSYIPPPTPPALPVTFDDPNVTYGLVDFGGNASQIITDPANPVNNVVQTNNGAETWSGTFIGGPSGTGFEDPIPFALGSTSLSLRVWSPAAGIPVRFKVENGTNGSISVETETLTTVASDWETMIFDFSNEAPGTPPLNLTESYHKPVVFFNFGTPGTGEVYYWDDMEFVGDPVVTFTPGNGASNVPVSVHPEIAFSMPVEMANGNPVTNGDIPSIVTFKETGAGGANVPFTGTINAEKKVITMIPNSILNYNQVYYLALNDQVIRYQGGNLISGESITFTTIANPAVLVLYDNFDDPAGLTWGYWDNNAGGVLDVAAPNPDLLGSANTSPIVAKYTREAGSDPYTHAFSILGGKLDISLNNLFQMFVRSETAGTVFALKLQNNDLQEPWTTEVTVDYVIQNANIWEWVTFDFSPYSFRTDLDKVLLMINPGQVGAGVHYFDEVYGPPFTAPAASPVLLDAYTTPDGSAIELKFDKDMEPEPGNAGNFNVYVNGANNYVSSTLRKAGDFSIIVLNLTNTIAPGDVVTVSYLMSGTITSLDNGVLQPFTDFPVTNMTGINVDLKVFLEGPFEAGLMTTYLNSNGYIPLGQPFNIPPWNYPGTESVASIPNGDIVDWILIELRETPGDASTATGSTIVATQAAFLKKDGTVRSVDGNGLLYFNLDISQNLFAVVWTRNHLGIMSANPIPESAGVYIYDYSSAPAQAYGGFLAQKEIEPGLWGMIGGDADANGNINNQDKVDFWVLQSGSAGYLEADFNMNGNANNQDKIDVWAPNSGSGNQVPD
ncbi:MAG: Ig-like domain-containing protein [Bacteroidales bacterium]|nr:Ig-like domain-containing protein [Bacteroidales bacterium]